MTPIILTLTFIFSLKAIGVCIKKYDEYSLKKIKKIK